MAEAVHHFPGALSASEREVLFIPNWSMLLGFVTIVRIFFFVGRIVFILSKKCLNSFPKSRVFFFLIAKDGCQLPWSYLGAHTNLLAAHATLEPSLALVVHCK